MISFSICSAICWKIGRLSSTGASSRRGVDPDAGA
jgi:hypothetical protein